MSRLRQGMLALTASLLVAAAAGPEPEELVRQGNAAFAAEDFEKAVALFDQAEERITDPGLVSFNKGAALYRLGKYGQAEAHYRRCLEDATGPRRSRLHFDLANSQLQLSEGTRADVLDQASRHYRQALAGQLDDSVRLDAEHNLELARMLWVKAMAKPNPQKPGQDPAKDPPAKIPDPKKQEEIKPGGKDPGPVKAADPLEKPDPRKDKLGKEAKPTPTDQPPPPGSSGNLQPVPDRDPLTPLPAEETIRRLQQGTDLILRERKEYQRRSAPVPANLIDY